MQRSCCAAALVVALGNSLPAQSVTPRCDSAIAAAGVDSVDVVVELQLLPFDESQRLSAFYLASVLYEIVDRFRLPSPLKLATFEAMRGDTVPVKAMGKTHIMVKAREPYVTGVRAMASLTLRRDSGSAQPRILVPSMSAFDLALQESMRSADSARAFPRFGDEVRGRTADVRILVQTSPGGVQGLDDVVSTQITKRSVHDSGGSGARRAVSKVSGHPPPEGNRR